MMDSTMWEERSINREMKYEKNLSFTAVPTSEDDEYGYSKKKLPRDPLSHRIIEKRRRDRMNNCLSDLSRLIPSEYMKKGRGRVEKTEIIEMAIRHMKHLQAHPCTDGSCCPLVAGYTKVEPERNNQDHDHSISSHIENRIQEQNQQQADTKISAADHYRLGFNECLSETMHFLVEVEGFFSSDSVCLQLTSHLHNHCENILKGKAFMAQVTAAAQSKRRMEEMDDEVDIKQGMNGDGYTNGYHIPTPDSSRNGHNIQEHNSCTQNKTMNPYQNHSVFPDSSSSALQPNYTTYHNLPRSIAFSQQLSPTLSCQGSDPVGSYKFKEDIRKRFCKEAGSVVPVSNGNGLSTRRIPVFALSSRGSYYIPLTLDLPYLDDDVPREDQTFLHPVTISVCFPSHHHSPSQQSSSPHDTGQ